MAHDVYCALCAGPLRECEIAKKSRGSALRAAASEASDDEKGDIDLEDQFRNDDAYWGYDPEIADEESSRWTSTLHVLGFNSGSEGTSNAYVSGPGTYSTNFGEANFDPPEDDPNYPQYIGDEGPCYFEYGDANTDKILFPFHWCCYEILARVITGTDDVTQIDKDLLYLSMQGLVESGRQNRLCLNYGDPSPESDQYWKSKPGEEYLVAHPMKRIDSTFFLPINFKTSSSSHDLSPHVRYDPFTATPLEIIYQIVHSLPPKSLINIMKASWSINIALPQGSNFWLEYLKRNMPWFFELHENLESIGANTMESLHGKDIKGLFLWADKISTPKFGLSGWRMGLANRRRIWKTCEDLKETYISKWNKTNQEYHELGFIESMIQARSGCLAIPLVSYPVGTRVPNVQYTSGAIAENITKYWIRSWPDLSMENLFEVYWDTDGIMVGISLTTDGEVRQFGEGGCNVEFSRESLVIDESDWITGLILHIPRVELCDYSCSSTWTSVKGLTVIHQSGIKSQLGVTDKNYMKRPLLVSPGSYIVGLRGQSGPSPATTDSDNTGTNTINRIGLLQADRPNLDDYSFIDEDEDFAISFPESEQDFEKYLWRDDCSSILGRAIWEQPRLRQVDKPEIVSEVAHPDMIPHEALIWAKDKHELRSLKRISAYIIPGDCMRSARDGEGTTFRDPQLCGLKAEFHNGILPRVIGASDKEGRTGERKGDYSHFNINGPNGEFVDNVCIDEYSAVRLHTNNGREIIWALPRYNEHKFSTWTPLEKEEDETVIGLLMTFAKGCNYIDKNHRNTSSTSIVALLMPLGDSQENQENQENGDTTASLS